MLFAFWLTASEPHASSHWRCELTGGEPATADLKPLGFALQYVINDAPDHSGRSFACTVGVAVAQEVPGRRMTARWPKPLVDTAGATASHRCKDAI